MTRPTILRNLLSLAVLLLFAGSAFAQGQTWTPRSPLQFKSSLHAKILSGDVEKLRHYYGDSCLIAAKDHLKAGGDFYSKTVVKYSTPFEKTPRADVIDNTFFHWTDAKKAFNKIAAQGSYEDMFSYVRDRHHDLYDWYLYVAADPESSLTYGRTLYQFSFKKGARIFFLQGDYESGYYIPGDRLNAMIVKEIAEKNPALKACDVVGEIKDAPSMLVALAIEASDISLIAYIGNDNKFGTARGDQWLQVVGPWVIESMKFHSDRE